MALLTSVLTVALSLWRVVIKEQAESLARNLIKPNRSIKISRYLLGINGEKQRYSVEVIFHNSRNLRDMEDVLVLREDYQVEVGISFQAPTFIIKGAD